jgi:hypothetical protein
MRLALFLTAACIATLAACGPKEEAPVAATNPAPAEAAAPPPAEAALVAGDALRADGWGPLKIGMTEAEVIAAVGDTSTPNAAGIPGSECAEFKPQRAPGEDFWVMIESGKLTRITIGEASKVKTDKRLGVGDTAEAVRTAYGAEAKSSPHKYQDKPAEYITVWSGGPRTEPYVQDEAARGIVYEIGSSGKVSSIHAGGPSIQYVEGCA